MDVSRFFKTPSKPAYFDSGASSLTALPVLKKMEDFYGSYRANIHRGAHTFTRKASEEYEATYGRLAKFFHARDQEFINVRNCTEGLNGVALGLKWKAGDEVITTDVEHHSNFLPWLRLREQGVKVKILEAEPDGVLLPEKLKPLLSPKTRLFAFSACSNVLGTALPLKELVSTAKDGRALVVMDAAQYVGHHPVDLSRLPVDFMSFSAHKCFGPTGVGVLFHREGVELSPWFLGGGTVREVTLDSYKLLEHRERYEAGTPAIAEWIGLGAALDTISSLGYPAIEAHEQSLIKAMLASFSSVPKATLYGPKDAAKKACALFAFNVGKLPHHEVAIMFDKLGFAMRSGHHCAMPLTKRLGVEGTVRASLHVYNTEEEAKRFAEALAKVAQLA